MKKERFPAGSVPSRLLGRLDDLGAVLARRGDALALIALGSVGRELDRLDEHSDLDFFVIVEDTAKRRYLEAIDWLEEVAPVAFSYANTADGRKVLFADRLLAEYAVFTVDELRSAPFSPGRVVWQSPRAPGGLETPVHTSGTLRDETIAFHANEALTNLLVGLHRAARGEQLSAMRLIQVHALDRALAIHGLLHPDADRGDAFAPERRAEARFGAPPGSLAALAPGYGRDREAALALLRWLEARTTVDPALAEEIRALAGDADSSSSRSETRP